MTAASEGPRPDAPPAEDVAPLPPTDRVGRRTHPLTGAVQGALWTGAAVIGLATSYLQGDQWGGVPWWLALGIGVVGGLALGEAAGFLTWWFTRYVVDTTELRIDSGILTKRSRRAAFERIQSVDIAEPLLARMVGLAEVRVDLAGGDESRLVLKFLPLAEARGMRRLLLDRAHGRDHEAEADEDEGELITRVPPIRNVIGTLISLDFLAVVAVAVVVLLAAIGLGQPLVALGGIVPLGSWAFQIVARRIVAEWDFTLRRTDHGLRIECGLLSRTSQTIPFARVQGVATIEPIVWRALGWRRLEVDVAGAAGGDDEKALSTLLPIADPALAEALVAELVPPAGDVTTRAAAAVRSWPFAPVGWRFRNVALDTARASSTTGWLTRRTSVAPHRKVQSVAVRQGPLQRRLGLATVELHTPDGPVDVDLHHGETEPTREVALAALALARRSR